MIRVDNVSKKLGDRQLFHNFSITIPDKAFVMIIGESGSGKTTLLNMIGGIEPIDSGRIIVNEKSVQTYSKRKLYRDEFGFLFQNFALIENKTVEQNLSLIITRNKSEMTIQTALAKVGLSGAEKKKVYQLSDGEQQRVALDILFFQSIQRID